MAMAQAFPKYCPRCGAETVAEQKFCPKCGLAFTSPSTPNPQSDGGPSMFAGIPSVPDQQPVQRLDLGDSPSSPGTAQKDWSAAPDAFSQHQGLNAPAPTFFPIPDKSRRGLIIAVIAIIVVFVLLVGGILLLLPTLGVGKPTQAPITTTNVNATVNYAGVDVTIVKIQQAQNFLDDPATRDDGMVRLQLRAQNGINQPVDIDYNTMAHLLLPNGKVLQPIYVNNKHVTVAAGKTQTGTVDFAVPIATHVKQLVFRLGAADKAQLDIPLAGGSAANKYGPKTKDVGKQLSYLSLGWNVAKISSQYSIDGQQASKGMRFVIITLKVDNTLTQKVIPGSPYDYIHLKAGGNTLSPVASTMPTSFDAGVSGKEGTVTFLVSQDISTVTMTLSSPQNNDGFDQTSIDLLLS